jgi:FAD/FMN-containing dehydrogenase
MIEFAARFKIRIAARGHGHQPFGQAQVSEGLIIDMRPLREVHSVHTDRIDIDAGADWRTVLQAALQRGLTPPVLTAYLGLTVGGTLSIGGVGIETFRYGAQVDNVLELEVITGDSQIITCSDKSNRDLFLAALAGQGQCAMIKRAVLRLVPAPATVREYVLPYTDVWALLEDQQFLIEYGRFQGIVSVLTPSDGKWMYSMLATRWLDPTETIEDVAMLKGLRYIAGEEQARSVPYPEYVDSIPNVEFEKSRPDLGLLLPASSAASFLSEMLPRLTTGDWGSVSRIRLFCWKRRTFTRPLLRVPEEENFVYVAFLRTETTDPQETAGMLKGNRILFERCRDLGGTLYPFSALDLSRDDWQQHYGESWSALVTAKMRYDPHNVFASGPDIFVHGRH